MHLKLILKTDRLYLREFELEDDRSFFDLNADPEVLKFTGDRAFQSVTHAREFIRNYKNYEQDGFGRWAVVLKKDDAFIGWCGLKQNPEENNLIDLGYRIFRKHWNQGYTSEAARACLAHGFGKLAMSEIIARADFYNKASIRVMEKIGMSYWKEEKTGVHGRTVYYKISKAE